MQKRAWMLLAAIGALAPGGCGNHDGRVSTTSEPPISLSVETREPQARAERSSAAIVDEQPVASPDPQAAPKEPILLSLQPEPESVYAPPVPQREGEGINEGAVHFDLTVRYMTDYIYRGLNRSSGDGLIKNPNANPGDPDEFVDPNVTSASQFGHEDAPNLQVEGKMSFDLGKFPHPYFGAFVNVYDSDPTSRFQEVRPNFGFEWTIRPFIFEGGHQTFLFPERDDLNTSEVYCRFTFDDSFLFKTDRPILSPYIYAAYDYDLYNGWYFEAGCKHDFVFEDWGLTLTPRADVAYVMGHQDFLLFGTNDTGFQHYDVGMVASYSINHLFNFSTRYGSFNIEGYLFYTDNLDDNLIADNQVWGGVGLALKY